MEKSRRCPVCGYGGLLRPPYQDGVHAPSFEVCPSCDTEFGYDDAVADLSQLADRHRLLREAWVAAGMQWSSKEGPPKDWNPRKQLLEAGLGDVLNGHASDDRGK